MAGAAENGNARRNGAVSIFTPGLSLVTTRKTYELLVISLLEHGFRNQEQRLDVLRFEPHILKVCNQRKQCFVAARRPVQASEELGKRDVQGARNRGQGVEM